MGTYAFKLPDIGEGIAEAELAEWKVSVGDEVAEDQSLCDMLTDKAAVELPSPVAGKILEIKGEPGDLIAVGSTLVLIQVAGDAVAESEDQAIPVSQQEQVVEPPAEESTTASQTAMPVETSPVPPVHTSKASPSAQQRRALEPGEKPLASPAVRRRALERGIELAYVRGTGPAGRISHEDLEAYVSGDQAVAGSARQPRTGVENIKIIGLRRKIAESMQQSKRRIPHFSYIEEVDVTELELLRQHMNANRNQDQPKLTVLPFLMQALIKVVPEFPKVNANFDDDAGVLHRIDALHIGIAAQTDNGLVVPVVHHAETLDIWGLASELVRLTEAVRSGRATREELSGSSITISSLGPMGGIVSTPVINAPEVAIVGVNKMAQRPMILDGAVVPRTIMNLSSSFDHRIVDGWDAASFIQGIKACLEHPSTLFL